MKQIADWLNQLAGRNTATMRHRPRMTLYLLIEGSLRRPTTVA